jgi:hypothetical protein
MESKRLTTRRIMLIVVGVAVAIGLVWPLLDSIYNPNWHKHTYVLLTRSGRYNVIPNTTREPILTQYLRRLTGRDPREKRQCGASKVIGVDEEACGLEHAETAIGQPIPRQTEFADARNAEIDRKEAAEKKK